MIGMHAECGGARLFVQPEGGRVLRPFALRDDHRALCLHLARVEEGIGHAVGFDVEQHDFRGLAQQVADEEQHAFDSTLQQLDFAASSLRAACTT